MNLLQLRWKTREGGSNWTKRNYLDFIVDEIPLSENFGDLISCLGWAVQSENEQAVKRLLLEASADFSNNRRSLYVCPECGDLGCGAVSVIIEQKENKIIWRDFAFQYDYSDDLTEYKRLETFVFDKIEYEKIIKSALSK